MKKYLFTLSLLPLAVFNSQAHAVKIYTCEVNGSIVYTSRPSDDCQAVNDLPVVGKYSSSRYDAPVSDAPTLNAPTSQTVPAKSKSTTVKSNHKATPKPAPIRTASEMAPPPVPKSAGVNSHRSVLETESSNERAALADAEKQLSQARTAKGDSVNQRAVSMLQGAVLDREKNIQALQRESGRMQVQINQNIGPSEQVETKSRIFVTPYRRPGSHNDYARFSFSRLVNTV